MHDVIEREMDRVAASFTTPALDLPEIVARGRRRLWARRITGALTVCVIAVAAPYAWIALDDAEHASEPREDRAAPPAADYEWQPVPDAPLKSRANALGVWTGEEYIVWGGQAPNGYETLSDGAAYDPEAGSWRELAPPVTEDARLPREEDGPTALWSGSEMLLWGGADDGDARRDNGAAYNPATDAWRKLAPSPVWSLARHSTVWTGMEMIVFGGIAGDVPTGAAAYNPRTDAWRVLPEAPIAARHSHAAAWTGTEMVVWGGRAHAGGHLNDGAAFDPASNSWRVLPESPLSPREQPLAAVIGDRVFIWGGTFDEAEPNEAGVASFVATDGAIYDPATDTWAALPPIDLAPQLPFVQGGAVGDRLLAIAGDLALYDVPRGEWAELAPPSGFGGAFAVITTEDSIFVWGGFVGSDLHSRGALLRLP
ncbi:MAG: hypothetical protein M3277_10445 [Actinomycetota bacterium]|nr:hypothetical protein [Actinomycetota bacterium]